MTTAPSQPLRATRRGYPKGFWVLLAIAIGVRLTLIVVSQVVDHGEVVHPADFADCRNYNQYGELFANGLEPRDKVLTHRDRLLPFILGLVFRVTGRSVAASQLTNAMIALMGLFALYPLAREFLSRRFSLLVCGLWVFDPSFVGQSCMPLTENVATPLIIASLLLLVRARRRETYGLLLGSALVLVAASHARTSTFVLTCAIVPWLLVTQRSWSRRLGTAGCYGAVMVAGWLSSCAISYRLFGVFTPNTHSYSLWDHAAAKIMVQQGDTKNLPEAKRRREARIWRNLPDGATFREYLEMQRKLGWEDVRKAPRLQLRNHLQALVATTVMPDRWSTPALLGKPSKGGIWHGPGGPLEKLSLAWRNWGPIALVHAGLHTIWTFILWAGACLALPTLWRRGRGDISWLLVLVVLAVLAGGAINVEAVPRYRLPAVPMMSLLAVMSLDRWLVRRSRGTRLRD